MMAGMEGPHLFEITVNSNDADSPITKLQVKADFEPVETGSGNGGQ